MSPNNKRVTTVLGAGFPFFIGSIHRGCRIGDYAGAKNTHRISLMAFGLYGMQVGHGSLGSGDRKGIYDRRGRRGQQ